MSRRTRSQWFSAESSRKPRRSERSHSTRPEARRLRIERLEERTLLAVFSVTNVNDSGAGSLRQAVLDANGAAGADEIVFSSLFDSPQTINLTSAQLTLTDAATTTITGTGAHRLTVSGSDQHRVFEIGAGASASLSGLTITRGHAEEGGGLFNSGTVLLTKVAVRNNVALYSGGGLFNYDTNSTMTLVDCTISGNGKGEPAGGFVQLQDLSVLEMGGGIHNRGTLLMTNCTVSGNVAIWGGGLLNGRHATLVNCTVSGNYCHSVSGTAGVDAVGESGAPLLTMYNTIVSGNLDGIGRPSDVFVRQPPLGHGLLGSHNLIGGDTKLGALADYGGSMLTMMPAADSPAHGAGTATVPGIPIPTTDQMGNIRPAQPSIGAMEGNYTLTVTTTDNRGPVPGEVTLAAAVHRANLIPGPNTIAFSSLFDTPQTIDHQAPMFVTDPAGTTIDGQGRLTLSGGGSITVRFGSLALSGVTLTGGRTVLRNLGGDVALSGVTVTGNHAINRDAVIQNGGQDLSVLYMFKGPIFNNDGIPRNPYTFLPVQRDFDGTMTLTGCTISDNDAGSASWDESIIKNSSVYLVTTGLVHETSLTITESTISGNGTNSLLHATVLNVGLLTMSRSTVRDNVVRGTGGGLVNDRIATLTDCTFSGNSAGIVGGGIANGIGATLTMSNCTVSDNTAGSPGNSTWGLPIRITPQITANFLGGGGLFNLGSATLVNSTVSDNTAIRGTQSFVSKAIGGGVLSLGMGTVTLSHTIIAGNTATAIPFNPLLISQDVSSENFILPELDFISQGHNLIGITDGTSGWGATDLTGTADNPLDPLLAPLGDYGGPTWTMPPLAGSPAIDAGDPLFDPSGALLLDQRGKPRVQRGAPQTETNDLVGLAEIKFGTTGGTVVTPVDAFASSYWSGLHSPANLFSGPELDISSDNVMTYTHAPDFNAYGMWVAGNGQGGFDPAPIVDDQYLVLELAENVDLSQAYLWQMVQTSLLGRGIKEFRVYGSPDAPSAADKANPPAEYDLTGYSLLLDTTTLAPGPQSGPSTTQAFALTNATNVRTIYLDVVSSYNTGPRVDIGAVEAPAPPELPGDYNRNGAVDAADYVLWRKNLGAMGVTPYSGADGDGNGAIEQADYAVWRANFGLTLPIGASGTSDVASPESTAPASESSALTVTGELDMAISATANESHDTESNFAMPAVSSPSVGFAAAKDLPRVPTPHLAEATLTNTATLQRHSALLSSLLSARFEKLSLSDDGVSSLDSREGEFARNDCSGIEFTDEAFARLADLGHFGLLRFGG